MKRLIAWIPFLVLVAACDAGGYGTMISLQPPVQWEQTVAAERAHKDQGFRTSPDTPLPAADVEGFGGLDYWPPDARYYYVGPIHVYPHKEEFKIITTAGKTRPCERFGWIEFPLDGEPRRLQVYRLLDLGIEPSLESLLLPFTDGTTGTETYPAGRYVDLVGSPGEIQVVADPGLGLIAVGPYVLDFNRAYNPSCAYGAPDRFACPVTPRDNRLDVRIEAGERGFKPLPEPPSGG